jgi:hypothetical protein
MSDNIKLAEIKCGLHCIINTKDNYCIKTTQPTMPYNPQHGGSVEARDVSGKTRLLAASYRGQCNAIGQCCHCFICTQYYWDSMDSLHIKFDDSLKYM